MGPSQPRPGERLTPSSCLNMLPAQFCSVWPIQQHVVCSNGSYFTRSTLPLQLLQGLNTFIQVNIMGARHDMYIQTQIQFTASLLVLPFDLQAVQLAPDFHAGNNTPICQTKITLSHNLYSPFFLYFRPSALISVE